MMTRIMLWRKKCHWCDDDATFTVRGRMDSRSQYRKEYSCAEHEYAVRYWSAEWAERKVYKI